METRIVFSRENLKSWLKLCVKATLCLGAVWLVLLVLNLAFGSILLVAAFFILDLVMKFLVPLTVILACAVAFMHFAGAARSIPKA